MAFKNKKFFSFIIFFYFFFNIEGNAKDAPSSFADLAESLMPSVVNISTSQTIVTKSNPFPGFEFPPGSPFEDMFKDFGTPQQKKLMHLDQGLLLIRLGS